MSASQHHMSEKLKKIIKKVCGNWVRKTSSGARQGPSETRIGLDKGYARSGDGQAGAGSNKDKGGQERVRLGLD